MERDCDAGAFMLAEGGDTTWRESLSSSATGTARPAPDLSVLRAIGKTTAHGNGPMAPLADGSRDEERITCSAPDGLFGGAERPIDESPGWIG